MKLTEGWLCRDDVGACLFKAPELVKSAWGNQPEWNEGGFVEWPDDQFIEIYGKSNLPPKGKKWWVDIEL